MILGIGRQEITLTPVGTLLFGSKGRVDVEGPAGRTRLVLVDQQSVRPDDQGDRQYWWQAWAARGGGSAEEGKVGMENCDEPTDYPVHRTNAGISLRGANGSCKWLSG
jgi:hypothetical protein